MKRAATLLVFLSALVACGAGPPPPEASTKAVPVACLEALDRADEIQGLAAEAMDIWTYQLETMDYGTASEQMDLLLLDLKGQVTAYDVSSTECRKLASVR